ncbi:hypothetical protein A2773_02065 [Candidatus Gottesmanbacteria bacterium RIFCSPHIGHO2_01_FULL_39_10]|uniref:Heat-inducible transcription repressor HrcA n=1 Tax=Candidatus Gottesmanbacteria bacterium RIFCSPHIGHO2_01_FULL_39_10 TaxID=1798375 RepID=A0A1F5ZRQ3_9BACT|nr:MAG: hypothetical protein A2773_02065 [Candidatus Gottesmanbacteria bacterium RIFCSPHIGHO2_01_FULL_39_10]
MNDLNDRQIQILKAIIEEYIETAEPVGSEKMDKKYNLGVSPATIRNEMVKLTKMGYLKQPHTSAGRTPSPLALKYYVSSLMKPEDLSVAEEVRVKQKLWDHKDKMDHLLREATRALASHTKTMSLAATDEGDIYTAGMGNILEMPEFYDIDMTRSLLSTLDQYDYWWDLFEKNLPVDGLHVLLGEDLGQTLLNHCGCIFVKFASPHHQGAIGIIGPQRLDFPHIIPVVRYIGNLVDEISGNL